MFDLQGAKECIEKYRGCGSPAYAFLAGAVADLDRLRGRERETA